VNRSRLWFICAICGKYINGYKNLKFNGFFKDNLPICKECRRQINKNELEYLRLKLKEVI